MRLENLGQVPYRADTEGPSRPVDAVRSATVDQPAAYMVPMVVEQTSRGERGYDIFLCS